MGFRWGCDRPFRGFGLPRPFILLPAIARALEVLQAEGVRARSSEEMNPPPNGSSKNGDPPPLLHLPRTETSENRQEDFKTYQSRSLYTEPPRSAYTRRLISERGEGYYQLLYVPRSRISERELGTDVQDLT